MVHVYLAKVPRRARSVADLEAGPTRGLRASRRFSELKKKRTAYDYA